MNREVQVPRGRDFRIAVGACPVGDTMALVELRGLGKGGNAPVNGNRCTVMVGFSGVDVVTFQLGADDRVRSDADVVFYNQPTSPEGAVQLTGPGTVTVLLDMLPTAVATVAIAVAAADDRANSPLAVGLDVTLTTDVDGFSLAR
jgi:stress response protein SCP2